MKARSFVSHTVIVSYFFFTNPLFANQHDRCDGPNKALAGESDGKSSIKDLKVGETVWGKYVCGACGNETSSKPGNDGMVTCGGCGKPHDKEPFFLGDGKGPLKEARFEKEDVSKTEGEKKRADSGKKWTCAFCGNSQFMTEHNCGGCGGSQKASFEEVERRSKMTSSHTPTSDKRPTERPSWMNWKVGAGAGVGVLAIGAGLAWLFKTTSYDGNVSQMAWQHDIEIDEFTKVTKGNWANELSNIDPIMPIDGKGERPGVFNIRNCHDKFHHDEEYVSGYRTEYVDEPYEEAYQDTDLQDQGNGSYKKVIVTKYRTKYKRVSKQVPILATRQIFRSYCDYDTYEWKKVGAKSLSGNLTSSAGEALPWPNPVLSANQRIRRLPKYEVEFSFSRKGNTQTHTIKPETEEEFMKWKPNQKVTVDRRNAGTIADVKPAN